MPVVAAIPQRASLVGFSPISHFHPPALMHRPFVRRRLAGVFCSAGNGHLSSSLSSLLKRCDLFFAPGKNWIHLQTPTTEFRSYLGRLPVPFSFFPLVKSLCLEKPVIFTEFQPPVLLHLLLDDPEIFYHR